MSLVDALGYLPSGQPRSDPASDPPADHAHHLVRPPVSDDGLQGMVCKVSRFPGGGCAAPHAGTAEVTLDPGKLWTGVEARDEHLKSADFLDVADHPKIAFRGDEVEALEAGVVG